MRNRNTHLHFIGEAGTSQILTYLRRTEKQIVSFLSSTEPVLLLGDAVTSHFFISKTIAFAHVSDLCLLLEFLT
jgi:hypothetical protein